MARHKRSPCPYNNMHCHGEDPDGYMMCIRCYDDHVTKENGVKFALAEEREIDEQEA